MSILAGELLDILSVRLKMMDEEVTNPSESVKSTRRILVKALSEIEPSEKIKIEIKNKKTGRYIRRKTGEVIAELQL